MRVVAGQLRGKRLFAPSDQTIRPTSDRTREAMFDLLGPAFRGRQALDLFSGTGALGIEALSRGFERALFVEKDRRSIALLKKNLAHCQLEAQSRVEPLDVFRFLERPHLWGEFDLVLLDPPYGQGHAERTLALLGSGSFVCAGGVVICEGERELTLEDQYASLSRIKHRLYGGASVHLYEK
jgi:16S rRNA (guanine966-N2)-methyltransferase